MDDINLHFICTHFLIETDHFPESDLYFGNSAFHLVVLKPPTTNPINQEILVSCFKH